MRVRMGILAVALAPALALSVAACSGDDDPESDAESSISSGPVTEVTVDCPKFEDAAKRITDAQTALYDGTGGAEAVDDLVAELDALKEGTPKDIQAALTEMAAAFQDAAEILQNPSPENQADLADLAETLSADSQKITAYITSKCG